MKFSPLEIYRSQQIETAPSRVVVIHCSDPRYQPHFQDFLRTGLSLTHYGLIAVPGGVQLFSPSDENAALRTHGGVWLDFMAKLMNADRCILIGHADCRWYIENHIARDANSLKDDETRDINAVREALRRRFPLVNVELYFAELKGSQAEFTAL